MTKLKCVKVANSVKAGTIEETFMTSEKYDLELDDHIIKVYDPRSKKTVYTSLFNAIYWEILPVEKKAAKP